MFMRVLVIPSKMLTAILKFFNVFRSVNPIDISFQHIYWSPSHSQEIS